MQIKERAHNTDMKIVVSEMSEWVSEWKCYDIVRTISGYRNI